MKLETMDGKTATAEQPAVTFIQVELFFLCVGLIYIILFSIVKSQDCN